MKRKFWIISDKIENKVITVIDIDEIVAINVPDIEKEGCTIMLRSGQSISFNKWNGEHREKNIEYVLNAMTEKETI